MDRHSIRGWRNEAGEGGGGRDRSGNWNKFLAGIRNADFVIFVLEYQKEQREKNQVRIVFIDL